MLYVEGGGVEFAFIRVLFVCVCVCLECGKVIFFQQRKKDNNTMAKTMHHDTFILKQKLTHTKMAEKAKIIAIGNCTFLRRCVIFFQFVCVSGFECPLCRFECPLLKCLVWTSILP